MRVQYAAINDLESVAADIMKLGSGGRLAIVYDPKLGWCVTDEVEVLPAEGTGQVVVFRARTYSDWYQPHIANAMSVLGAVRFLGQSAMDKLFRKPLPPREPVAPPVAATVASPGKGLSAVGGTATSSKTAAAPAKQATGEKKGK